MTRTITTSTAHLKQAFQDVQNLFIANNTQVPPCELEQVISLCPLQRPSENNRLYLLQRDWLLRCVILAVDWRVNDGYLGLCRKLGLLHDSQWENLACLIQEYRHKRPVIPGNFDSDVHFAWTAWWGWYENGAQLP